MTTHVHHLHIHKQRECKAIKQNEKKITLIKREKHSNKETKSREKNVEKMGGTEPLLASIALFPFLILTIIILS